MKKKRHEWPYFLNKKDYSLFLRPLKLNSSSVSCLIYFIYLFVHLFVILFDKPLLGAY